MELYDYEKKHLAAVYQDMAECTLFLKKNDDFPLDKPCKIALYGNGGIKTVTGGTGSGEVNFHFKTNIFDGLTNAGFIVTTSKWYEAYNGKCEESTQAFIKQISAEAKKAHQNVMIYSMGKVIPEPEYDLPTDYEGDVAIYVLSRNSGEGADREYKKGDILLTDTEKKDILALNAKYKKFMLVLNVGGVIDISELGEVKNILLLSQLGSQSGNLLADILLGKANPSGKLATTWATKDTYYPNDFGDINNTKYSEGIYVGYRYFDSAKVKPLYPFGFGLSYTSFEISNQKVTNKKNIIEVSVDVKNNGKYAGKEVVQVYVSAPTGRINTPYQELKGFAKTSKLEPGKSETVKVVFDMKDVASYDTANTSYLLQAGNYLVRVGNSSDNTTVAGVIHLDNDIVTKKVNLLYDPEGFEDLQGFEELVIEKENDTKVYDDAIILTEKDFPKDKEVIFNEDVDEEIAKLSVEDVCYFSNGNFSPKGGIGAIGMQAKNVPGAAGETSELIKLTKQVVMSDGPAGLRLAKDYYVDKKGIHAMNSSLMPESMKIFMSPFLKFVMKLLEGNGKVPKDAEIKHQYCTDIPIGTALAQSFNKDYAILCGDIVGEEMEMFKVNFWLAPALNIHRDIRCGRNFEYYSEDPLVSGIMASGITKGVQKHKGCGVTLKHYALNNQETNRYGSNSIASERAIREIYVKGFEIAIKEASPKAIMTSYNLVNGYHSSESKCLIDGLLRKEFNYQGIVMSDWLLVPPSKGSLYRAALGVPMVYAGNDLIMPGTKAYFNEVLEKAKTDKDFEHKVRVNASRVYHMMQEFNK